MRKRILVVDDNVDNAHSTAKLLELEGHQVRVAHDGPEALLVAEAFRPEVVLLDIGLPGLSGYEVCRALRRRPWASTTPIFAVTGWGQEQDRRRSKEAGFNGHLVKPVEYDVLTGLLSRL